MRTTLRPRSSRLLAQIPLLVAAACGGAQARDEAAGRELAWRYGPTTGTATKEHLIGTGTRGGVAVAEGWRCHLRDDRTLTVEPYRLARSHELFGKAVLLVGLFDASGQMIDTVRSTPITAAAASCSFELTADTAKRLADLILWYRGA